MNSYFIGMIISMILYIVIGIIISTNVKNANDFYVAGRKAPTYLITGSLVASYCSTGLFMGDVGEAYDGFYTPVLITVAMLITGYTLGSVFFGKYLRRSKVLTMPEFFGKRFHSRPMKILASVTGLVIYLVYMLSIMQGIGTLMNYVTGIGYNICILLALITFTILTVTSGSKGVLITDTIMFGVFTIATLIASFVIVQKAGGWENALATVTAQNPALFSWHGNLEHLYPTGTENMIWALMTGATWITVCMVGPWQSSRYLMAKNEHVVIRSSGYAALGVFFIEFFVMTTSVFIHKFHPDLPDASYAMIWAATNLFPTILGVIMLTGVLAAGISSATTFLSLISSCFANDLFEIKDDKRKVAVGRIAICIASSIILLLAVTNPPNIYVIMCLSGTVVACAWFPVCMASVWSKRITKTGAFCGMLFGFLGCAGIKVFVAITKISLPIYFDAFFIGLFANVLGLVIGSAFTKVTAEEKHERELLMITPKEEFDPKEIIRTKKSLLLFAGFGVLIMLILLLMWAVPYSRNV